MWRRQGEAAYRVVEVKYGGGCNGDDEAKNTQSAASFGVVPGSQVSGYARNVAPHSANAGFLFYGERRKMLDAVVRQATGESP